MTKCSANMDWCGLAEFLVTSDQHETPGITEIRSLKTSTKMSFVKLKIIRSLPFISLITPVRQRMFKSLDISSSEQLVVKDFEFDDIVHRIIADL